jgi:hypothetical protein
VLPAQFIRNSPGALPAYKARKAQCQLLAELELFGYRLVTVQIDGLQIIQQTPALTDHHEQSTPRTMILFVLLQVIGQMVDALRQQRNLHIRRTGIPLVELKITNRLRFCLHVYLLIRAISLSI